MVRVVIAGKLTMKLEIRTRRSFGDVKVSTRGVQVSLQVTSNLTDSYEETEQMRKVVEVIQGSLKEAGITPYFMPEKSKCTTPPHLTASAPTPVFAALKARCASAEQQAKTWKAKHDELMRKVRCN